MPTWDRTGTTLIFRIEEVIGSLRSELLDRLDRAGGVMESRIRAFAPSRSGALRDSIEHVTTDEGNHLVTRVGTTLSYAPYLEKKLGFFTRGVESAIPDVKRILMGD